MIFTQEKRKLCISGDSLAITINKKYAEKAGFMVGDIVNIQIEKALFEDNSPKEYICGTCGLQFSEEIGDDLHCPNCEEETYHKEILEDD